MVLNTHYTNPSTSKNTNTANQTKAFLALPSPTLFPRNNYYYYYQPVVRFSSPFSLSIFAFLTKVSYMGMYSRHPITTGWMNVCMYVCVCVSMLIYIPINCFAYVFVNVFWYKSYCVIHIIWQLAYFTQQHILGKFPWNIALFHLIILLHSIVCYGVVWVFFCPFIYWWNFYISYILSLINNVIT